MMEGKAERYFRTGAKDPSRLLWVWLILIAATSISYSIFNEEQADPSVISVLIVVIAYYKARLVALEFLELRHAPWVWRGAFESWLLVASVLILLACLMT